MLFAAVQGKYTFWEVKNKVDRCQAAGGESLEEYSYDGYSYEEYSDLYPYQLVCNNNLDWKNKVIASVI